MGDELYSPGAPEAEIDRRAKMLVMPEDERGKIGGIKKIRRRMRGDIYEFTMSDGSTCAVDAKAVNSWNETIRRLLAERHGRSVSEVGEDAWQVA